MKKHLLLWIFMCLTASAFAASQDSDSTLSIRFDLRADGVFNTYDFENVETGFTGKYFKLLIDGKIDDRFSYSLRQRLYKDNGTPTSFFGATDWAYLTYRINNNWNISAGKQVVLIGGYEYDQAPIDVYFWSDFWNNVNPFQLGVSLGYTSPNGRHTLIGQVTNSPFATTALNNCFAYNLIWYGNFGKFKTIYSYNAIEYQDSDFIHYLALGNQFQSGNFCWELDYMLRASAQQDNLFGDYSIISRMTYDITEQARVFIKGGYDQNNVQNPNTPPTLVFDRYVVPGVEYAYFGGGIELFPIKAMKKTLRVHAYVYTNNNDPQPVSLNVGIRWQMNVLKK